MLEAIALSLGAISVIELASRTVTEIGTRADMAPVRVGVHTHATHRPGAGVQGERSRRLTERREYLVAQTGLVDLAERSEAGAGMPRSRLEWLEQLVEAFVDGLHQDLAGRDLGEPRACPQRL